MKKADAGRIERFNPAPFFLTEQTLYRQIRFK